MSEKYLVETTYESDKEKRKTTVGTYCSNYEQVKTAVKNDCEYFKGDWTYVKIYKHGQPVITIMRETLTNE
jgi:hypothetical protein